MPEFFLAIYNFYSKRRKLFVATLLFFLFLASLAIFHLDFETNIYSFFPKNHNLEKVSTFLQNSPLVEKIIVSVNTNDGCDTDPDLLIDAATDFSTLLRDKYQPTFIKSIRDTVSDENMSQIYSVFYNNLPLFMNDEDYSDLESRLDSNGITHSVESCYKLLMTPGSFVLKDYILKDPLGISFKTMRQLKSVELDDNYHLNGNFVMTKDDRTLLLFINPAYSSNMTSENQKFFSQLDKDIAEAVKKSNNRINILYYGVPVVSADNAGQIQKDIFLTVNIALVIILLLVFAVIKEKRLLFVLLLPVLFGFAFSVGMIFVIKGKISLISLGIGSALLGIMIDYAIHVSTHFRSMHPVRSKFKETVFPVIMCCTTNVSGFLCLHFIRSDLLKDLSFFAIFNIIGAAMFSLIIVPQFYRYTEVKTHKEYRYRSNKYIKWIFSHSFENSKVLIAAIVAVTVVCAFFVSDVKFQDDFSNLNFTSEKMKVVENKFGDFAKLKQKTIMLISEGSSLDEALVKNEKVFSLLSPMQSQGMLDKVVSVTPLVSSPDEQSKKIERWNRFWTAERKGQVKRNLSRAGAIYSFKNNAFAEFYSLLDKKFDHISYSDFSLLKNAVFTDLVSEHNGTISIVTMIKGDRGKLGSFYSVYENRKDVFSGIMLADMEYLTNRFVDTIKKEFNSLSMLDSILIFSILLIFLGRFELATISFLPIALSWIWILGIMGMAGIKFNIFNIIISSIIFGLGVDYSILMVQGLIHNYKFGGKALESSRESIFFSALTNITGMGVLFFAKHPVLKSIAMISSIGIFSVFVISNIIPPLLFKIMVDRKKRLRPFKFIAAFIAVDTYALIGLGCILLTLSGFLVYLLPLTMKRKRVVFSYLVMYACRFMVHCSIIFTFYAKIKVKNSIGENFKKPAVIMANHQSLIDIIILLSLSPRTIVLTKEWIWKSKVFGLLVRLAGYYPVSSGIDTYLEGLQQRVSEGFSVIIFPEGTRSDDSQIGRFRKGAVMIAEKLNLDLLPVFIHGTGDVIKKKSLLVYRGSIEAKIGSRIDINVAALGEDYSQKAKFLRKMFQHEIADMRIERETPSYFADFLVDQYVFKSPVLEWYVRVKLKLEKNYEFFHSIIPRNASIVDVGCGYGYLPLMLALSSNQRRIIGTDYDKEKVDLARNIVIPGLQVEFLHADATAGEFPGADVFILNDMLHYMPEEMQVILIEKCMRSMNAGGKIIIRDADSELSSRHFYTRISEKFSTRLGFNKAKYKAMFFVSAKFILSIADKNGFSFSVHDKSIKTSNKIYILEKK